MFFLHLTRIQGDFFFYFLQIILLVNIRTHRSESCTNEDIETTAAASFSTKKISKCGDNKTLCHSRKLKRGLRRGTWHSLPCIYRKQGRPGSLSLCSPTSRSCQASSLHLLLLLPPLAERERERTVSQSGRSHLLSSSAQSRCE